MQMDEMLKQVRCKYAKETFLEASLHELKGILDAMKPGKEKEVSAETNFGGGVRAPILIGSDISTHKFAFVKPASGECMLFARAPAERSPPSSSIPPQSLHCWQLPPPHCGQARAQCRCCR